MTTYKLATIITTAAFGLAAGFVSPVFADSNCVTQYGQYGSSTTCYPTDLTINKQVQDPRTGEFVENITTALFSQGDTVVFKMMVKNSSSEALRDVKVTDGVPENLIIQKDGADMDYVNSVGKKVIDYSGDLKNVTYTIDEIKQDQVITMILKTKLVGPYPTEDSFCRDNWANVTSAKRPDGDKNFARFCVQNKVLGTSTLPVAGVNDFLVMIPFITTGIGGLALLRKK